MARVDIASSNNGGEAIIGTPTFFQHNTGGPPLYDIQYDGEDKTFWRRCIINFDLSPVAGRTLTDATLTRTIATLLNGGADIVKVARILDPDTVGVPCWIDQDHPTADTWDDVGGDFDFTGPPAGFTFLEATGVGEHVIDDAALLVLAQDALDNRANVLMLLIYLSDEDPGVNTGARWHSNAKLTVAFDDVVTPTAHRDIVVSRDRGRRPRASRRVLAPRRPRSPRRPNQ